MYFLCGQSKKKQEEQDYLQKKTKEVSDTRYDLKNGERTIAERTYSDKVLVGDWVARLPTKSLPHCPMAVDSTYTFDYADYTLSEGREPTWGVVPGGDFYKMKKYYSAIKENSVRGQSDYTQGWTKRHFDKNMSSLYNLTHQNAVTKAVPQLIANPRSDLLDNYGVLSNYGLLGCKQKKWNPEKDLNSYFTLPQTTYMESYKQHSVSSFPTRRATPKKLSTSFFSPIIDTLHIKPRNALFSAVIDYPEELKETDPKRKPNLILSNL